MLFLYLTETVAAPEGASAQGAAKSGRFLAPPGIVPELGPKNPLFFQVFHIDAVIEGNLPALAAVRRAGSPYALEIVKKANPPDLHRTVFMPHQSLFQYHAAYTYLQILSILWPYMH